MTLALVTGGSGFIGSRVVARLLDAGIPVRVLDLDTRDADDRVEVLRGDLRDPETAAAAVAGATLVCHQAAKVGLGVDLDDVTDYVSHNALGTAQLLRALHETSSCERLVVASSMVVYGEGVGICPACGPVRPGPRRVEDLEAGRYEPPCPSCGAPLEPDEVTEDAAPDPRNVYAATKLHQEHLASSFARETGVPVTALRYHNVYGPGMPRDTPYAGVASIFRSALAAGRPPRVFEDGGQRRDFVHVDDVAEANRLAMTGAAPEGFTAFNVASGEPHTVLDMARALSAAHGGPAPEIVGGYRLGDVRHVVASARRAREVLGFAAATRFEDGMRAFAAEPLRQPAP